MGRNAERLQAVADACRARGAVVEAHACDLCEGSSGQDFIRAFAAAHPIDLLIVNAGVFRGHHPAREMEDGGEITAVLRTNLEAAILTIAAALPAMRARGRGRIAIIGSLAALHPLADAPAYSASKAGLMAYGEALREWLLPDGVAVSLVYPGHIETAHVAGHVGALPLIAFGRRRRGAHQARARPRPRFHRLSAPPAVADPRRAAGALAPARRPRPQPALRDAAGALDDGSM